MLVKEIGFVKMKIEHIKEIVAAQQNYGKIVGWKKRSKSKNLIQDVFRIHAGELAQHEVKVRRNRTRTSGHSRGQCPLDAEIFSGVEHECLPWNADWGLWFPP